MSSTPMQSNESVEGVSAAGKDDSATLEAGDQIVFLTQTMGTQVEGGKADTSDSMDVVSAELEKAIAEPTAIIKEGQAPTPFMFGFEPSEKHQDQVEAFSHLMGMATIIRMFAAMNTAAERNSRKQSKPYSLSIPIQYVAAFNEGTEAVVKTLTVGPLGGIYDSSAGGMSQSVTLTIKRAELHPFILKRIFSGLVAVKEEHMDDLDYVLTNFVSALKAYDCDTTGSPPVLKHVVLVHYVRQVDITGGGNVFAIEPFTRMVIISLKPKEWATVLEKPGFFRRNEKVKFTVDTTITEMKLDEAKYQASKSKYQQALELMIGENAKLRRIIEKGGIEAFGKETCHVIPAEKGE